ncbi:MAG: 4-hydroxy-tetrahydrodipicolinate reductase [Planctomycetota bacterium]
MNTEIKLAVHGAAGRMGRRVVALAAEDSDFRLAAAIDSEDSPTIGQDAGLVAGVSSMNCQVSQDWPEDLDVVIDFSLPEAIDACIDHCVQSNTALVVATTGLSASQKQRLQEAAKSIPVVWAPSMSLAVNLCMRISQQITRALANVPGGTDIEIIERHHRFKADAPSGTALRFGELIAEASETLNQHVHGREGHTGARSASEIGYHAIRTGDDPGQHTILFGMLGEKIELNVAASNRDCYASGALAAGKWLLRSNDDGRQTPGVYNMFHVLGLD